MWDLKPYVAVFSNVASCSVAGYYTTKLHVTTRCVRETIVAVGKQ